MNELLTKYYLQLALGVAFLAAALWALVALFGFTSLEATGADATAAALGLVICFLVTFMAAVLGSGVYDGWRGRTVEEAPETVLWAAPVQRERMGFALMAGSLLLLVSAATGAIAQPLWPALSGILLFGGGLVLVGSALQDAVGPDRPFHQHLNKKEAERKDAQRKKAEKEKREAERGETSGGETSGGEEHAQGEAPGSEPRQEAPPPGREEAQDEALQNGDEEDEAAARRRAKNEEA